MLVNQHFNRLHTVLFVEMYNNIAISGDNGTKDNEVLGQNHLTYREN